jgi:hypothetical protein
MANVVGNTSALCNAKLCQFNMEKKLFSVGALGVSLFPSDLHYAVHNVSTGYPVYALCIAL